jgi:spore coat polysaccharide biosynthesis predicted glycosyltransferase SpsG
MRSSAIAEELIARGEDVVFVGQISGLTWVEERITALGFSHIHHNENEYISNPESDVLLIDSYEIELDNAFIAAENWLHIVSIVDDLTPNYRCTLKIYPGLDSNWVRDSRVPVLAGPKYIPFRSSLSKNIHPVIQKSHNLRIAVVAGGSDPYGLVDEIAEILLAYPEQFEAYLFSNSLLDSTLDSRFHVIQVGEQLDDLTKSVDLVLTTASTSSLEFLARGLCVGVACAADNQKQYYNSLGDLTIAAQIGFRNLDNQWQLDKEKIYSLIISSELRASLLAKASGLIDFKGASRIVDAITTL